MDPLWEKVYAHSMEIFDIDHDFVYWEIYVSVPVGDTVYWCRRWLGVNELDDTVKVPTIFRFILNQMVEELDHRIKEVVCERNP